MSIRRISQTIDRALAAAGLSTTHGPGSTALEAIRAALQAAHLARERVGAPEARAGADPIETDAPGLQDRPAAERLAPGARGRFLPFVHTGALGSRAYKLYVPDGYAGQAMPLIVMLHGCKQNPDDFAAGTRINAWADERGFLAAYPAQSPHANGSNCWNWFEPQHQRRDGVEPSLITGIVREVGRSYRVDEGRVYVAGLSAGAAMAVILGETHPDVFAAVGAHSGLPYSAAHDVPSAFAAMRGGASPHGPDRVPVGALPTIVFHGARDATVAPRNGAAIAQRAVDRLEAAHGPLVREVLAHASDSSGHTRTVHRDRHGRALVEHWSVHGGGHAWSGGSRAGSFAEPGGPDASREMVRFFLGAS